MTTPPRRSVVATSQHRKGMRVYPHCRSSPREQPAIARKKGTFTTAEIVILRRERIDDDGPKSACQSANSPTESVR